MPEDLFVASYTDSPELSTLPVPVTALDLSPRRMGRESAELLADLLEGRVAYGSRRRLPTELRIRASTLHRDGS